MASPDPQLQVPGPPRRAPKRTDLSVKQEDGQDSKEDGKRRRPRGRGLAGERICLTPPHDSAKYLSSIIIQVKLAEIYPRRRNRPRKRYSRRDEFQHIAWTIDLA